jgi:stage III sporulation protein SpoIIIAA
VVFKADLPSSTNIDKFYEVTKNTIDKLVSQTFGTEFPLVLSEEELRIVKNYKTSTLILGRSGTGKTTCLVYKLVGRYLASNLLHAGRPRRQVWNPSIIPTPLQLSAANANTIG